MRTTKPHSEPTPMMGQRVRLRTAKLKKGAPAETATDGPTAVRANVILQHSRDAARVRRMALVMLQEEAEASSRAPALLRDLSLGIDAMVSGGKVPPDLLMLAQGAMREALALNGRAGVLKNLAGTLAEVAAIEHGVADSIRNLLFQHFVRLMGLQIEPNASDHAQAALQRNSRP